MTVRATGLWDAAKTVPADGSARCAPTMAYRLVDMRIQSMWHELDADNR